MATDNSTLASAIGKTAEQVSDTIDSISRKNSLGAPSASVSENLFGINQQQTPPQIQINKDYYGFAFFTRPELNLTSENIRSERKFTPLLSTDPDSIQRAIRCLLDPRLVKPTSKSGQTALKSTLTDSQQAFIPILTNNLITMSGWPDIEIPTTTSHSGMYKEEHVMVDGITDHYAAYDISCSFRNLPSDPITKLLYYWSMYSSKVFEGVMVPYPDKIIENEIDYNTRIYRLVLDSTKTKVQKIAATGAAIVGSLPIGASFDIEAGRPINNAYDQITVTFKCMGALYYDDILIDEFNRTVAEHNDAMSDTLRPSVYQKLKQVEYPIFNNICYPRINPDNYDLEWWVEKGIYNSRLK